MDKNAVRKALFTACKSKEELDRWIRVFLNIRFPDKIVSDESNSSPLEMIWQLYDRAVRNDTEGWKRVMVYANRFGGKTLAAAVLETVIVLHTRRNLVHMAAIKDQSKKAQEYVKGFFYLPYLKDFVVGDNDTEVVVVTYENRKTGIPITEKEYLKLAPSKQDEYRRKENYIRIIVCTMQSTNGQHVEFMCVDGSTKVLVATGASEGRRRKALTARGLFRVLQGKSPTGRYPDVTGQVTPTELVEMATFDWTSGRVVFRPITFAVANSRPKFTLSTANRNLVCSDAHQVWTLGHGMKCVSELNSGDKVVVLNKGQTLGKAISSGKMANYKTGPLVPVDDDDWYQVMLGSMLGDGGVYKKTSNNAYYSERHCTDQKEYFEWKLSILGRHLRLRQSTGAVSGYTGEPQVAYASGNTPLLNEFSDFKKTLENVDRLGPLGLAVWYMDDGHGANGFRISSCSFTREQNEQLAVFLKDKFGIECSVVEYDGYLYLSGAVEAKRRLAEVCAPYIHPSMAYKFDVSKNKKQCKWCETEFWPYELGSSAVTCSDPVCTAIQAGKLTVETVTSVQPAGKGIVYDFTVDGTNNFFTNGLLSRQCVDEVDVIPKGNLRAYDQAKNGVPTDRGDLEAMTLFTSTRKSRIGKVQAEIDDAARSGLRVNHWNIIDITEPCPTTRHRPNEPKQMYWVSDADVSHISEYEYDLLPETDKSKFYAKEGYAGCAKCPLFAACKGRLATEQEGKVGEFSDGGTALLLKIDSVIDKFRGATPEFITTEFLCRKPDTSGLVYPRFNASIHVKSPNAIAEEVNGAPVPENEVFDKHSLLSFLVDKGAKFVSGMDFGYNHLFAVVTLAVWGNKAYVVDAVGLPKQELDDKLELTAHLRTLNSTIFGDPEDPASITTFKRKGYRMKEWSKNAGSVKAGIEIVRAKLYSKNYGSTLTFMSDDNDIATLIKHIEDYHYTTGQDGKFTEEPDDSDDDYPDALRYAVMNTFGKNGSLKANLGLTAVSEATKEEHWTKKVQRMNANAMGNLVRSLTNGESGNTSDREPTQSKTVKRGGFYWDNNG